MKELREQLVRRIYRLQRAVDVMAEELPPQHPAAAAANDELARIREILSTIPDQRSGKAPGDQPGAY